MSMLKDVLKRLLQFPADALLASSGRLPPKIQKYKSYPAQQAFHILQKSSPYPAQQTFYFLRKSRPNDRETSKAGLPVPPRYLRESYGNTVEIWLNGGKLNTDTMMMLLNSANFSIQKGNRVLDFGCGPGRMIRWLAGHAAECEIWGVDINARDIVWCQENLNPPFYFATVTTEPHLPFEDRYFDLIYCASVFTHIDDLTDAWLLELKRIMRPGGKLYITVHDKHTVDLIINHGHAEDFKRLLLSLDKHIDFKTSDYYMVSLFPGGPDSQVFYDIDYLRQHWGRILNIISVTTGAWGYQTAILLEK